MRIIYMGTPDFAVPALEELIKSKHEVIAVITQPDKPKGRGKKVQYTPVKEVALENSIEVLQPIKVRESDFVDQLSRYKPDCIIVAAYGQILPKEILEMPTYGCINIHASLLPKLRGAAPIHWAIVDGEEETGITIMQMDEGLDTGDMISKVSTKIDKKNVGQLHDELSLLGGDLLIKTLEEIEAGTAKKIKQDDSLSTYAKMLNKKTGIVNWTDDAMKIERLIRGLNPWPTAFTTYGEQTLKIWEAEVVNEDSKVSPGTILEVSKEGMKVATGKGMLVIKRLQFPNKKAVTVDEYIRGNQIDNKVILGG